VGPAPLASAERVICVLCHQLMRRLICQLRRLLCSLRRLCVVEKTFCQYTSLSSEDHLKLDQQEVHGFQLLLIIR